MTRLPVFPTIGKIIKDVFKEVYQSFSYSALTSMVSATFFIPILFILFATFSIIAGGAQKSIPSNELFSTLIVGVMACFIWNTLVSAPIATAFYCLYQDKKESYPGVKTFLKLLFKYYGPSFMVNGVFSLVFMLLFINVMIALIEHTILMAVIGIFSFYLLIFIVLMSFYFMPLIYLNNGFKKTLKKAFLLVMDNTGMTVGLMLLLGIIFGLTLLLPIFWFLIYGAILVYVTDIGFNMIYDRYEG